MWQYLLSKRKPAASLEVGVWQRSWLRLFILSVCHKTQVISTKTHLETAWRQNFPYHCLSYFFLAAFWWAAVSFIFRYQLLNYEPDFVETHCEWTALNVVNSCHCDLVWFILNTYILGALINLHMSVSWWPLILINSDVRLCTSALSVINFNIL